MWTDISWISTTLEVHNMLVGVHEEKAIELEKRALDLWDRVYQAWIMNALEEKTIGPKVTSKAVYQTWYHFLDGFQKTPELMNMKTLSQLLQNNTETLKGGLESLWDIAKGNASILLHAISTMLSVLFNHGFAVFNFFISMVIFLTALFYLLNSSRQLYKPVEMACTKSPVYGERLGLAFEKAINEVLIASFKLAIFYGMWTWLIHNIFQMNIVYIPTVLATILAVVPVLGTYWACLPGVIDLWLVQGKNIHAIVLACFQFLPTTIVDATIYNEINSGHPYLTGLSVAGGLFCLGIEGAIIGPLVLCGLHVVINLSTVFLQDSKTTQ
uniref:Transmembrane protein 245 n=1 Tax=Clastoptera arizonana TaxID=38151 RepID=A0A1B6CUZ8_9HEMI